MSYNEVEYIDDYTGLQLILQVLSEKSWDILSENNILDNDFFGNSRTAMQFIREYFNTSDEFPPIDFVEKQLRDTFPAKINREYAVKQYRNQRLGAAIKKLHNKYSKHLNKGEFQEALNIIQAEAFKLEPETRLIESFKATIESRQAEYRERAVSGVTGVIPPWISLQNYIHAWENSTFNVILGTSSSGKSWTVCLSSVFAAFSQGKNVLHVTMEDPKHDIESRMDALYFKIPFGDLRQGIMDYRIRDRWYLDAEKIKQEEGDIKVVDNNTVRTIEDVYQIFSAGKFDFVVVDAAYKLETTTSNSRGDSYQKSNSLLKQFNSMANSSGVPWLASNQLNIKGAKESFRDMAFSARGNQEWMMDPATVISVLVGEDDILLKRAKIYMNKNRNAGGEDILSQEFYINSNRTTMDFSEQVTQEVDQALLDLTV